MESRDIHGDVMPETSAPSGAVSPALAGFLTTGWAQPIPVSGVATVAPYAAKRRAAMSAHFPGETLVIPTGAPKVRANDTDYAFRPGSDFAWLTGAMEPDAVLVLRPDGDGHRERLYVPRSSDRTTLDFFTDRRDGELWVGRRRGVETTATLLGIDTAPLDELGAVLTAAADGRPLRVLRGLDPWVDARLPAPEGGPGEDQDVELARVLSELRLVKDDFEVAALAEAAELTARGFEDVVAALPGAREHGERWLEGTFWRRARAEGNDVGYGSICASGPNATTLHWTRNDGPVRDGDLLLADMGVETRALYTADITRTMPVSGQWSAAQRRVYEAVFAAQEAALAVVAPGQEFLAPNRAAQRILAEALAEWGLLPVSVEQALSPEGGHHRRYTLHGVSHMLGIDVHDCARARDERYRAGTLEPGHVLTVEPGLYFQPDDLTVPEELRGIGVRIEDDVLVTGDGMQVLSSHLPRDPDEISAWVMG